MNANEFFKKMESGKYPGEPMDTVENICEYVSKPDSHKVYNTSSPNYANGLADIFNSKEDFEARVFKMKDTNSYQLGVFHKKH